ncbi:hypothetical protein K9K85_01730 [Patescibacteria group bacterium]|nr:hypothetical protein [Patescibacteria group bacterium]
MIKFNIILNKLPNFYFFIQNLSQWHCSCRERHNIFWQEKFGVLTKREKQAIADFKKIHLKYPFGKNYLGRPFFDCKNPWAVFKKELTKKEFENLQGIFSVLKNKFEIIYKQELPYLEKWQKALNERVNNKNQIQKISQALASVFNLSEPPENEVNVYLLISSPKQSGGGSNIDNKSISIEISRQPLGYIPHIIGTIWHETTHLCFQNHYFMPLVKETFPRNWKAVSLIKEAAISSLFPKGILAGKFLKIKVNKERSLHGGVPTRHNERLLALTESYLRGKFFFDKKYIEEVYSIIS